MSDKTKLERWRISAPFYFWLVVACVLGWAAVSETLAWIIRPLVILVWLRVAIRLLGAGLTLGSIISGNEMTARSDTSSPSLFFRLLGWVTLIVMCAALILLDRPVLMGLYLVSTLTYLTVRHYLRAHHLSAQSRD